MSTPNDTLAINIGSKNRSGVLSAMIHMKDNDTYTMAVFRADAGKWRRCSDDGMIGRYDGCPKPIKGGSIFLRSEVVL